MDPLRTILLVEDDRTILMGLAYSLQQEGYSVLQCVTAEEARAAIAQGQFDLALLDINLPDGSGYDLCRLIRKSSVAPVVFLTAYDDEVNAVMGLDMGADDYITKPFRVHELMSRLRSILRRAGSPDGGEQLHLGNISINVKQARVLKGGEEIPLTALEYRLLLTLSVHSGQVLSRTQLLEGIWDASGEFVNDNTLSVYIKRLREKLGDDPQNPRLIQTVRGLGYRAGE
jgi:DNA-binding response OmpR family regulator